MSVQRFSSLGNIADNLSATGGNRKFLFTYDAFSISLSPFRGNFERGIFVYGKVRAEYFQNIESA